MGIELRKVTCADGADTYHMLQQLPAKENGFGNTVFGMPYEEYGQWLASNVESAAKTEVEKGWVVPQTTNWLYEDGTPVGIGRIRHFLTEKLLLGGAICPMPYCLRRGEGGWADTFWWSFWRSADAWVWTGSC